MSRRSADHDLIERLATLLSKAHISVYVRMFTNAAGYTDHDAGGRFLRANPEADGADVDFWLFDLLGLQPGDVFVDLFPGSGAVTRAWAKWQREYRE